MKKRKRLQTAILVLVFLIGAAMVLWPILTEVASYREDDAEYEAMSERYRLPDISPAPVQTIDAVVPEVTEEAADTSIDFAPVVPGPTAAPAQETEEPSPGPTVMPEQDADEPPEPTAPPLLMPAAGTEPTGTPEASPVPGITAAPKPTESVVPVTAPSATQAPPAGVDLTACLEQNSDFIAWLTIPGTKIDYPVVRSDRTGYYLHHLFSGRESKLGCLFSLTSSDYRTPGRNIAIYGHHLSQSNAMFTTLLRYKDASWCASHSRIRLETLYGTRDYRVFAVVNMDVNDWDASAGSFSGSSAFMAFVNRAREAALYETGVPVTAEDHILTLITCDRSYGGADGRLIVMAVQE